jgi:serine/threonine-protein kinase
MPDANLVLADRYQARGRLGSGAGAGVEEYLGRDLRLARPVVIQLIRAAGKEGFAPQARLMASLDHPAVASVYDWGQQGGLAYLIREYVPGQDLGRLLVERGALTVAQAAAIGAEVAAALAAAHRIGLAHGSLDAADVIVGDQRVTVVGFGAAWMREAAGGGRPDAPGTTKTPGTLKSPGTLGGPRAPGGPDPQDDLGALGAMLCQMVTGAPPERRPAASPIDGAGLPLPLRQIVERLTASDPDDRYRAAEAVRADLLHLAHGQASPVAPADVAPSWVSAAQVGPGGAAQARAGTAAQARAGAAAQAEPLGGWPQRAERGGGEAWGRRRGTRRRRRRGVWMAVIVGLALLGGAVAGVLALAWDPGERATIQTPRVPGPSGATTVQAAGVPDVVGLGERAATRMLERDGFVVNISRQPSDEPPGVVTSQSPGAGRHPPPGAIVFLTVSSGPAERTSPNPSGPGDTTQAPTTQSAARTPRAPTTAALASP